MDQTKSGCRLMALLVAGTLVLAIYSGIRNPGNWYMGALMGIIALAVTLPMMAIGTYKSYRMELPVYRKENHLCLSCGYSLKNLPGVHLCPECGTKFRRKQSPRKRKGNDCKSSTVQH